MLTGSLQCAVAKKKKSDYIVIVVQLILQAYMGLNQLYNNQKIAKQLYKANLLWILKILQRGAPVQQRILHGPRGGSLGRQRDSDP